MFGITVHGGRIGGGTHRSNTVGAGAWEWTSASMRQEHTALEVSQHLPAGGGRPPVTF